MVHEQKVRSGETIADAIIYFLKEIDEIKIRKLTVTRPRDRWKPLIGATMAANFDGSFDICNSRSCSGVMVIDSSDEVLFPCSIFHQNVASSFAVEVIACFWALCTCNERKWLDIKIEGDVVSIIRKCNSNKEDRSEIGALIRNINQFARNFQSIHFRYVNREANYLANILATESLKREEEIYLEADVPCFARRRSEMEKLEEPD